MFHSAAPLSLSQNEDPQQRSGRRRTCALGLLRTAALLAAPK